MNNRIKEIEEAHRKNETRKFYKDIKTFRKTEQAGTLLLCKDDKGNVLTEKQRVLERWKHHFNGALNREQIAEHTNSEHETENLTFRHRASCILGQAFHYSPENAFYIFNQQIYFII